MTQDEIVEMARQAGVDMSLGEHWSFFIEELKAFAKLVAEKAIKEALAQEQEPVAWEQFYPDIGKPKFVAQPEQEPVAWFRKLFSPEIGEFFDYKDGAFARETDSKGWTPLYVTPPQRKPLPFEQVDLLWHNTCTDDFILDIREFAQAIESAHGIKGD